MSDEDDTAAAPSGGGGAATPSNRDAGRSGVRQITLSDGPSAARVEATELLGPSGRLVITHAGRRYILRFTKLNRLLLTKDEAAEDI
ncbi:MAG: hemin uptake protein HemP [Pseudomonadota bacterium]